MTDWAKLITGFLGALLLFFGTVGLSFDWFTTASIDALGIVITAAIPLGMALYGVWKHNFVTKKAKQQKEELKKKKLL